MELSNQTNKKFLRFFKHKQEYHMPLLPLQKPDLTQKIVPNPVHMLSWKAIKRLSILSYFVQAVTILPFASVRFLEESTKQAFSANSISSTAHLLPL
jgi:hypothetical protein